MNTVKSCVMLMLVGLAAESFAAFSGHVFYWKGADWAAYDNSANWTVGAATSPYADTGANPDSLIPGVNDMIYAGGSILKIDLAGTSQTVYEVGETVDSYSASSSHASNTRLELTNGTLTVTTYVSTFLQRTVWSDATLNIGNLTSGYMQWGWGGRLAYTVKDGGTVNSQSLIFQGLNLTIDKGGVYRQNSTSISQHKDGNGGGVVSINGRFEAPYGVQHKDLWGTAGTEVLPGLTFNLNEGGEWLLGGNFERKTSRQALNANFAGGTLIASNDVAFVADSAERTHLTLKAGSPLTVEVLENSSLSFETLTVEDEAALVKTGEGVLNFLQIFPSVDVQAGAVRCKVPGSFENLTMANGTTLGVDVAGVRIDSLANPAEIVFSFGSSLFAVGQVVLSSASEDVLLAAQTYLNGQIDSAGVSMEGKIEDDELVIRSVNPYTFDATKSNDLSDPTAWKLGEVPPATATVSIKGDAVVNYTASSPRFALLKIEEGATLAAIGGTSEAPVDLPAVELDYKARLLVSGDAVVQMTNVFTCVCDATTLPILEVATNATLIAESPEHPRVRNPHVQWDYYLGPNYGFTLKNVRLNWYGTIKMAHGDAGNVANPQALVGQDRPYVFLTLGTAAAGETSYIAIDCQGGTYLAAGNGPSDQAAVTRTSLLIAVPENGGTVVPVETIRLRDYHYAEQPTSDPLPSGNAPGVFIGKSNPWYTGNPESVEYDVVVEGNTDLTLRGGGRISGGAHVCLKGPAKWRYDRMLWNDEGSDRGIILYDKATLTVEGGALLETAPSRSSLKGFAANTSTDGETVLTVKDSIVQVGQWSGNGKGRASLDNARLEIGVKRVGINLTDAFAGLKEVSLENGNGLTITAVPNAWKGAEERTKWVHWNREVTIGAPLAGTGGLVVSNDLTGSLAAYAMTVFVTNDTNTATGEARACTGALGAPARLVFGDGANWVGTVVADANVVLSNLTDAAAAATVNFGAVAGAMPIRVWKTGGVITANDKVNLGGTAAAFEFVAMDEKLTAGDVVELGLYPESAALPANTRHVEYSSVASATPGFVTLCAKQVRPGMLLMVR